MTCDARNTACAWTFSFCCFTLSQSLSVASRVAHQATRLLQGIGPQQSPVSSWVTAVWATLPSGKESLKALVFSTMHSCKYFLLAIKAETSSRVDSSICIRAPPASVRAADASEYNDKRAGRKSVLHALTPPRPSAAALHHAHVAPTFAPLTLAADLVMVQKAQDRPRVTIFYRASTTFTDCDNSLSGLTVPESQVLTTRHVAEKGA